MMALWKLLFKQKLKPLRGKLMGQTDLGELDDLEDDDRYTYIEHDTESKFEWLFHLKSV